MPNTEYATTEQVAEYYRVDTGTIEVLVSRNRDELESDNMKMVKKSEIKCLLQGVSNIKVTKYQGYINVAFNNSNVVNLLNIQDKCLKNVRR